VATLSRYAPWVPEVLVELKESAAGSCLRIRRITAIGEAGSPDPADLGSITLRKALPKGD